MKYEAQIINKSEGPLVIKLVLAQFITTLSITRSSLTFDLNLSLQLSGDTGESPPTDRTEATTSSRSPYCFHLKVESATFDKPPHRLLLQTPLSDQFSRPASAPSALSPSHRERETEKMEYRRVKDQVCLFLFYSIN